MTSPPPTSWVEHIRSHRIWQADRETGRPAEGGIHLACGGYSGKGRLIRIQTLKITGQMGKETNKQRSHAASNRLSTASSSVQHPYASSSSPPRLLPHCHTAHSTQLPQYRSSPYLLPPSPATSPQLTRAKSSYQDVSLPLISHKRPSFINKSAMTR